MDIRKKVSRITAVALASVLAFYLFFGIRGLRTLMDIRKKTRSIPTVALASVLAFSLFIGGPHLLQLQVTTIALMVSIKLLLTIFAKYWACKPSKTERAKAKPKPNAADIRIPVFVCEICVESRALSDSFDVDGCIHFYCIQCIVNYVVSKLDDNVTSIRCPVPDCDRGVLGPDYCRSILLNDVFDRWGNALCDSAIVAANKFYCPYKDCSALSIIEGGEDIRNSRCTVCRRDICVKCTAPWHDEIDCAEYRKLRKRGEDSMLKNLAKRKNWRTCPNCNFYIQKHEGYCNYMRCRCGCTFCYNCGARYNNQTHLCPKCRVFK